MDKYVHNLFLSKNANLSENTNAMGKVFKRMRKTSKRLKKKVF